MNKKENFSKEKIATLSLMAGMFFLPFGYDALFALIMRLTGSYWKADLVFYFISALFFGCYFYFSGNNPIRALFDIIRSIWDDKIKHYAKKIKRSH